MDDLPLKKPLLHILSLFLCNSIGVLDQFIGLSGSGSLVVKKNIVPITTATVSTKGITAGANAALAAAEALG